MSDPARAEQMLVLGVANSGKTTFLIQLFGRLKKGSFALRARGVPRDLARLEAGLARLNQGLPVEHTPSGHEFTQSLPAITRDGRSVDIALPDYSGEDLSKVVRERRLPERWRELARETEHWALLLRLSQQARTPDVLSNPIGELATRAWTAAETDPDRLPLDIWAVELLQMLLYARAEIGGNRSKPLLSIVLSCWDELNIEQGRRPRDVASERLALLDSFCKSQWSAGKYCVFGLSAQGQELDREHASAEFMDSGPERMGWLTLSDGTRDSDLTLLTRVD
jgi:hypothetical protein